MSFLFTFDKIKVTMTSIFNTVVNFKERNRRCLFHVSRQQTSFFFAKEIILTFSLFCRISMDSGIESPALSQCLDKCLVRLPSFSQLKAMVPKLRDGKVHKSSSAIDHTTKEKVRRYMYRKMTVNNFEMSFEKFH